MREKKIHYKDINVFITCSLCNGYLIDAATIPECLHTCMFLIVLITEFISFVFKFVKHV